MKNQLSYRLLRWLLVLAMPVVLSWPCWINGQPFFFADTSAYVKGAARVTMLIADNSAARAWLEPGAKPAPLIQTQRPGRMIARLYQQATKYTSSPEKNGVIAGRSVYYGLFILILSSVLGLSAVAYAQALLSMALVATSLRAMFDIGDRHIAAILLALALASPLPFFNSILMPDVFAGMGMYALAALLLAPAACPWVRCFWGALVAAAVLFHSANIIIFAGLFLVILAARQCVRQAVPMPGQAILLVAVLLGAGVAGEALFAYGLQHYTHTAPIRPPFVTARLLADGPGRMFVARNCAPVGFEICRYQTLLHEAPAGTSSDEFLWSTDPRRGVFTLASKASRIRLANEDADFAAAVAQQYPGAVLLSSLRNVGVQFVSIGLAEFNYSPGSLLAFSYKLPAAVVETMQHSLAGQGRFRVSAFESLTQIFTLVSMAACAAYLLAVFWQRRYAGFLFVLALLAGILINALVCGALSTPHDRYQARVVWLLQLLALQYGLLHFGYITHRSFPPATAGPGIRPSPSTGIDFTRMN